MMWIDHYSKHGRAFFKKQLEQLVEYQWSKTFHFYKKYSCVKEYLIELWLIKDCQILFPIQMKFYVIKIPNVLTSLGLRLVWAFKV